jgi:hypothetical protein
MSPAPAAAAKNTNIAAEGKSTMTDEELQLAMKEVSENLEKLSHSAEPLTREEGRRKQVLLFRKDALEKIKEAKEKGKRSQELRSSMDYSILTDWGEKHPFLAHIMRLRIRNNILD